MKRLTAFCIVLMMLISLNTPMNVRAAGNDGSTTEISANSKPQVIIDSFTVKEGAIAPGSDCTLQLNLKNTSKYTTVKDLVLTYNSSNNNVYPKYGKSNQVYIESLAANASEQVTIELKVSQTATSVVPMVFTMEYRGGSTQNYSNNVSIFLPIVGRGIFEVNKISMAKETAINSKTMLSVNYGNYGDDTLYNVVMHIKGEVKEEQKEILLNDIEPGAVVYQDYYVNFTKLGAQQLTVSFTFEDKDGNEYNIEDITLDTTVIQGEPIENQNPNSENELSSNTPMDMNKVYLIAGGAILVILIIVGLAKLVKKK